jgi:eukaryotic-like serine/threonine-protein kinase
MPQHKLLGLRHLQRHQHRHLPTPDAEPVSDVAAIEKICPQCGRTYGAESVFCAADGSSLRPISGNADLVGTVIADRYLVLDKLGEGGMGRVYRARHVRLPQEVAIKVLSAKLVNDPDSIARFNREAANASSISSEHVARVFDFGETGDGLVYLAMEFVPGRTLRGVLEAEGPLQPHRAAALVWQIGEGLDAAHRRGIVHRDLKPENVIVYVDTDGSERLKVVDFGIAKALADGTGAGRMTRTGLVIGTPEYMSPEQITGDAVDGRSDVYALALVACVLLTGQQPFDARTPEAAMTARLLRDPRPLRELLPTTDWPAQLQAVINQGLARDPAGRFPTAGEFAGAVADAVDGWLAPDEGARTGVMNRPTGVGRRAYGTPARPTTAIAAGTAEVSPLSPALQPTGYGAAAADAASQASLATSRTEPRAATPAASGPAIPPASLAPTGVVGPPPRAPERAATPPVGGDAIPSGPAPAPAPVRSRGLVIGGAVAGVAVLAAAAYFALQPGAPVEPAADTTAAQTAVTPSAGEPPVSGAPQPGAQASVDSAEARAERVLGSAPLPLDADAANRELDSIDTALQPDEVSSEVARRSIQSLQSLLPRLPTAADSARADLLRFQAHVHADQIDRGCAILRRMQGRTLSERQRAVVQLWTKEICQGGG